MPNGAPDRKKDGVVWVAFGHEFLMMALHSARTTREQSPALGTALITNVPLSSAVFADTSLFDHVVFVEEENKSAFRSKLYIDDKTPFARTLFLDADTEIRRDLAPIFRILDHFPFAICPRETPCNKSGTLWGEELATIGLREFNSGVFAFDMGDPKVPDFFDRLRANFAARDETVDQPSFMVTIYEDPSFPVAPLSVEWNATNRRSESRSLIEKFPQRIGVYHYREPLRHADVASKFLDTVERVSISPNSAAFEAVRARYAWPRRSPLHRLVYRIQSGRRKL